MKIHEYQAKEILRKYGVITPRSVACFSVDEAVAATEKLGGKVWVVKAQIHAGGRGKGGGVKVAKSVDEVRAWASKILGMQLKTHQTGPAGQKVRRLLIEEGADIRKELYIGLVVDRGTQEVCVMASSEGGMDIEEVAAHTPEKIHKVFVDPQAGLADAQADDLSRKIGIPDASLAQARAMLKSLYKAFWDTDASLVEINPLILTGKGDVVALDAKMTFDDNALYRHEDIVAMRDLDEEDPAEIEASKYGLSYISLDGNIGCLVNGAGLAMATMDTIKLFGGEPANFLDVGGGANAEKVTAAFKIMLANKKVKAILVNIFGGIMKCDTIANGIVTAAREVELSVPLVVRMKGTNEDLGKQILKDSGLPIISADNMADAARKVVATLAKKKPAVKARSGKSKAAKKPQAIKKPKAAKKSAARKAAPKAKPKKATAKPKKTTAKRKKTTAKPRKAAAKPKKAAAAARSRTKPKAKAKTKSGTRPARKPAKKKTSAKSGKGRK
jgi:succinyl-CoA synthetase beta subunit